jgi:hypothetical protein
LHGDRRRNDAVVYRVGLWAEVRRTTGERPVRQPPDEDHEQREQRDSRHRVDLELPPLRGCRARRALLSRSCRDRPRLAQHRDDRRRLDARRHRVPTTTPVGQRHEIGDAARSSTGRRGEYEKRGGGPCLGRDPRHRGFDSNSS